jgi:hypothetical protein
MGHQQLVAVSFKIRVTWQIIRMKLIRLGRNMLLVQWSCAVEIKCSVSCVAIYKHMVWLIFMLFQVVLIMSTVHLNNTAHANKECPRCLPQIIGKWLQIFNCRIMRHSMKDWCRYGPSVPQTIITSISVRAELGKRSLYSRLTTEEGKDIWWWNRMS